MGREEKTLKTEAMFMLSLRKRQSSKAKRSNVRQVLRARSTKLGKDKHLSTLEMEMKQLKEEYEVETDKIKSVSTKAVVNFELKKMQKGRHYG